MTEVIEVLIIDDSADDAELLARELRKSGFQLDHQRVEDAAGLRAALNATGWDIILSDYVMPHFDSYAALKLVREKSETTPFIVVSGAVGEEIAVEVMKSGANDYLLKDNLIRLAPAIRRELKEVESRRKIERQLAVSEERLHQAQKLKAIGQLTGGIAHEFNNVLAAIIGNLDLIEERGDVQGESDKIGINVALKAAIRGADLTHRLLAFSRQQPLNYTDIQINELLPPFCERARNTLGEDMTIHMTLASDLWPIEADIGELEYALLNIAINAREAMPDGGRLTIATANRVLQESDAALYEELVPGDYVMIALTDQGTGMSSVVLEQVFEPFFTTRGLGMNSGLGLSMVFGFARQSRGQVVIESKEGYGTTVRIYLPRANKNRGHD